jgi:general L-amino acid transport system permease protein
VSTATQRTPLWRDVRVLRIAFQIAVVVAVGAFLIYIYDNLLANLRQQNIRTDFDFLEQPAGFRIQDTDFAPSDTVFNAFVAGFRNTIIVALAGCVFTLVLGTLIGIARLSGNWLVAKAAAVYVEAFRNLPPLLVIIFVNTAFLATLPAIDDTSPIGGLLVLSVGDNAVATLRDGGRAGTYVIIVALALVAALALRWLLGRREDRLGRPQHKSLVAIAIVTAAGAVGYVALGAPVVLSRPEIVGFQIEGGIAMSLPFVAVLVALVLYTASHVAEIVRGSILAVPRGQTEAARSIGLSSGQRLRYVVLPQAFRIATPPTINQFLNLSKNTSLGIAVGYAEAMFVTRTVIGNGQPAVQSILVVMAFYLALSLAISAVSNVANRRLQLVER